MNNDFMLSDEEIGLVADKGSILFSAIKISCRAQAKKILEIINDASFTWGHGGCLDDDCDCPNSLSRRMLEQLEDMK